MVEVTGTESRSLRRERLRLNRAMERESAAQRFKRLADGIAARRAEASRPWVPPEFVRDALKKGEPVRRCANCRAAQHGRCTGSCTCECPKARAARGWRDSDRSGPKMGSRHKRQYQRGD